MEDIYDDSEPPLTLPSQGPKKVFGSPPPPSSKKGKSPQTRKSSINRPNSLTTSFNETKEKQTAAEKEGCSNHLDRKRPSPITTPPEGGNNFDDLDLSDIKQDPSQPFTAKPTRNMILTNFQQDARTPVFSAYKPVDWNKMVFKDGAGEDPELIEQNEAQTEQKPVEETTTPNRRRRKHHKRNTSPDGEQRQQGDQNGENADGGASAAQKEDDNISKLFSAVLGQSVEVNSQSLQKGRQEFLQKAEECERVQAHAYVHYNQQCLKKCGMEFAPNSFQSELHDYANSVVRRHRFVFSSTADYRFRIAVTGPPKSGRSTLAGVLASRFITETAASQQWKQTMFLSLDFQQLYAVFLDPVLLLSAIAEATFTSLSFSFPAIIPIRDSLVHTFADITTGKTKLHPSVYQNRQLASDLQAALDLLSETWNDRTSMQQFYVNVFLLPLTVSRAFGLSKLCVVVDNYDLCNVNLTGIEHFEGSESIILSEIVALLLESSSFIIVGTRTEALFNTLTPLHLDSVDMTQSLTLIPSLGIVKKTNYSDSTICVTSDTNQKFSVTEDLFGGCTPFLAKWVVINTQFDDYEMCLARIQLEEEEIDEYDDPEEHKAEICQLLEEVLGEVVEGWGTKIVDISRKK